MTSPPEIAISFDSNGIPLKGVLHMPDQTPCPFVVGSHGLLSTKASPKQIELARACTQNGIAFFRFDHTGCGESSGLFVETSLETRIHDLLAACEMLMNQPRLTDLYALFGSSIGGATCLGAYNRLCGKGIPPKGIVTLAAPIIGDTIDGDHIAIAQDLEKAPLEFYLKNKAFDLTEHLGGISDILIFHGDHDEIVPFSNAQILYKGTKAPKKLIVHKNGDHRMSDPTDQKRFFLEASNWYIHLLGS